ncbi:hypothetical protein J7M23_07555 [Candidatus Sumerlaeota bacterium]|nr:hypothetical protein [Candidatus Sumerlaeota bacterium]
MKKREIFSITFWLWCLVSLAFAQSKWIVIPAGSEPDTLPWSVVINDLLIALADDWQVYTADNLPEHLSPGTLITFDSKIARDFMPAISPPTPQSNEIFIKSYKTGTKKLIIVIASGVAEKIYGGCVLAEEIRLNRARLSDINLHLRTPFQWRLASDNEENALRYGYNAIVIQKANPSRFVFFKEASPPFILPETYAYQRTVANRRWLRERLHSVKSAGLLSFLVCDEFIFPIELIRSGWRDSVVERGFTELQLENLWGTGRIFCIGKPQLINLYRMKYDEFLRDFPEVDAIMLRLGENRSEGRTGDYVGNAVYGYGKPYYCADCRQISYTDRIATIINETHKEVVNHHKRLYVHRTWDLHTNKFNNNPAVFRTIMDKVTDKTNLILSTKYTYGDFWQYMKLNPTFEVKGVPRIVEIQCTREYEGKGAFPMYIGEEVRRAFDYLKDKDVVGLWSWHHGGGGGGPEPKIDFWNQANIYLVSYLCWHPEARPEQVALRFAKLYLQNPDTAKAIADILILSDDAVRCWGYFKPYSEKHQEWAPSGLWVRDDLIRGEPELFKIWRESKEHVDEIIAEKDRAVSIVDTMISRLESVKDTITSQAKIYFPWRHSQGRRDVFISGTSFYKFLRNSLAYERSLFKLCKHYIAAYFVMRRYRDSLNPADKTRAEQELKDWEKEWQRYNSEIARLPFIASLYKDDGMLRTIKRIRYYLRFPQKLELEWWAIGPFDNKDKVGFDTVYPPEREWNLEAEYVSSLIGKKVKWQKLSSEYVLDDFVDMSDVFAPDDWITMYITTALYLPKEQDVMLKIGSDDAIKIWVNGELVHANNVYRAAKPDEDIVKVKFRRGENRILIKLMEGVLGCGFYFRITRPDDSPVTGLKPLPLSR